MPRITASQAFAHVTSALVGDLDLAGTMSEMLTNCAELTSVDACGLLVTDGEAGLDLLSATSHRVVELELYQTQISEGPCVDAWSTGSVVAVNGQSELISRWPTFGPSIVDAGFRSVFAQPLTWHSTPMGALNLFRSSNTPLTVDEQLLARAFADLAMVLIVHDDQLTVEQALSRTSQSLTSRTIIEQAKGVLAHRFALDMEHAYQHLKNQAADDGKSLTEMATEVVLRAQGR